MIFHRAIDRALAYLASFGSAAFVVLGVALLVFVAIKWWQRRRFYKVLRMARISVQDLRHMMDEGKSPIVLDVRTVKGRSLDPRRIQGAAVFDVDHIDEALRDLPRDREIVLYCT
jgi:flagellar biosynthesis protein FlhB